MDDFLHNLREREKQVDRNRRPYGNPQYRHPGNRGGTENLKPPFARFVTVEQFQTVIRETLPVLKSFLETLSEGQKRQADAGERIARAEELKAEALKALADYLRRGGALEAPSVDSARGPADIVETAVEKESAAARVEAEPEEPAPAGRERKSEAQRNTAGRGAGVTERVRKAIENNPGIDFKSLVKNTGLEITQVQNALSPLKKSGKIKSEGKGIYSPA
jgi:DNA-binding transcriptional ArsR family regulator